MSTRPTFLTLLALFLFAPSAYGQDHGLALDSLRRTTPSGQYADPASFFRMHGYTTLSYTANDQT